MKKNNFMNFMWSAQTDPKNSECEETWYHEINFTRQIIRWREIVVSWDRIMFSVIYLNIMTLRRKYEFYWNKIIWKEMKVEILCVKLWRVSFALYLKTLVLKSCMTSFFSDWSNCHWFIIDRLGLAETCRWQNQILNVSSGEWCHWLKCWMLAC